MKLFLLLMWNAPYFYHTSKMIFNDFTLLYFSVFSFDIPIVWKSQIHRQRFGSGQWTDLFTNQKPKTRDFGGTRRRFHLDCGSKSAWAFEGRIEKKRLSKRPMQYIPLSMPSLPSVYWYKSLGKSRFWKKYTLNSCLTFFDFFLFSESPLELA